jgi:Tfp pilus assembly protein PilF
LATPANSSNVAGTLAGSNACDFRCFSQENRSFPPRWDGRPVCQRPAPPNSGPIRRSIEHAIGRVGRWVVEPSWLGKAILLTRPGVKLEALDGETIAPRTAGVARDLHFVVRKEEGGRLRVESRRQVGWIAKGDAVLLSKAVAHFTGRLAKDPKDSHACTARGQAHAVNNESDKALADFDAAIRLDPKAILAYYHRANLAYGKGQYDPALADYNLVIDGDPAFDWAYHVRGWIYYRKKDYAKALADFETAIRLVPTESVFYRDRGNIALSQKDYDKALADYDKSIQHDPAYVVPWHLRGVTWQAKKSTPRPWPTTRKRSSSQGTSPMPPRITPPWPCCVPAARTRPSATAARLSKPPRRPTRWRRARWNWPPWQPPMPSWDTSTRPSSGRSRPSPRRRPGRRRPTASG